MNQAHAAAQSPPDFGAIGNPPQPSPGDIKRAKREAKQLMGPEHVRATIHEIAVWALRVGAAILMLVMLVRVWHLIGPTYAWGIKWRWLPPEELQAIDKMLFSSAFGGIVIKYIGDILFEKKAP